MSEDITIYTQDYIGVEQKNQQKNILSDINQSGSVRDWSGKKKQSLKLSASYGRLGYKKESEYWIKRAVKVTYCGSVLTFKECAEHSYRTLIKAQFCKDRLCPMCNWRRSRALAKQVIDVLHEANNRQKMQFLFLTLTVKNCSGNDLPKVIKDMFEGFRRLFQYKAVNNISIGYVRALEVTRNRKTGEYHPHFHVLICVNNSYFKKKDYIKQAEWIALWKRAMKLDYDPSVNIKKVKPKKEGQTVEAAAYETAKYTVKDADFLVEDRKTGEIDTKNTDEAVYYLAEALHNKRLIAFGKLLKEVRKDLKCQDIESDEADLIGATEEECKCPICQSDLQEIMYEWNIGLNEYTTK